MESVSSEDNIAKKLAMLLGAKLDTKTKFKLLDMIDERPVMTINDLDPANNTLNEKVIRELLSDERDYIICDSLFTSQKKVEFLMKCREEGEFISKQEGLMKDAGYGRGAEYVKDKKVRGDKFIWLSHLMESKQDYASNTLKLVENLTPIRDMINQ
jgi:hypothetical protein